MVRGVVFDVDDTLFLERDYVKSGFQAVSQWLAARTELKAEDWLSLLLSTSREPSSRGRVFDEVLASTGVDADFGVPDLLAVYRHHRPAIELLPGADSLLQTLLRTGKKLGIISDGPAAAQRAKVEALGLSRFADPIILTDEWGREYWKPHPRAFRAVETAWSCHGAQLVYVGDNPEKDFVAPSSLGWRTVRIRVQEQLHFASEAVLAAASGRSVSSFSELGRLLASWCR